jgi:hypothetical protein
MIFKNRPGLEIILFDIHSNNVIMKPKAKYIHGLLILICVMLGAVLVSSLLQTAFAYP